MWLNLYILNSCQYIYKYFKNKKFDETTGNSTPKYECKGHEGTIEDIAVSKSNDYVSLKLNIYM